MPVDAADAVGWPAAYRAVADGLLAAAKDLAGRASKVREANSGAGPACPAPVFAFPDVDAATRAGKADGKAVVKILDRLSSPKEEMEDLAEWLERTAERASDSAYAGEVLKRIGSKRIHEAVDMAVRAGPEARDRLLELIASASRGGTLDPKIEAALMRSPHLRLIAESDAQYSDAFAARVANTLLDPSRVDDPLLMIPGPSKADLEAARHIMERYRLGHLVDAAHLANDGRLLDDGHLVALLGNIYLPPVLVADTVRLAISGHKENAEAQAHLDAVLRSLASGAPCTKEAKRVVAAELAQDMDGLALRLLKGNKGGAVTAREAVWALMGDSQARKELVESAGDFVGSRFTTVAGDLARVLSANPGMSVDDAFNQFDSDSTLLPAAGGVLTMLDEWPGNKDSDVPALLGGAFGVVLAGVGVIATGSTATVALAGIGAVVGEASRSAEADADDRAGHQRRVHSQSIHDRAEHLAIAALLLAPGNPPLRDLLIGTRPTHESNPTFVSEDGTIFIPDPDSGAWDDFQDWMRGSGNSNLVTAVDHLLTSAHFT